VTSPLRATRAATTFLTRIPVGGFPFSEDERRWSPAYFPAVGAALGAAQALVFVVAAPLGPRPAAILAVGAGLLLTGAFHEDGLADTADALGAATHAPERLLEVLKDSRIGTFGAAALITSLGLRFALLAELGPHAALGLVLAQGLSRVPPVWQIATLPYVTEPGRARSQGVVQAGTPQAWLATGFGALLLIVAASRPWLSIGSLLALAVALVAVGLGTASRYRARAGGITGDFLGATQQVGELVVLVVLVAARAGGT